MGEHTKRNIVIIVIVAIVTITVALLATSLQKLNSDEVALAYDVVQKDLNKEAKTEGLHTGTPGFEFIIFPSVFKSLEFPNITCLNKDGVEIELDVTYQYKARGNNLHDLVTQFKDHDGYVKVLKAEGVSALHEACSLYNTSQFQSERGAFTESVRDLLFTRYTELKCDITDLQVNNIARPREYEVAIKSKEAARENITVAQNERPRLLTQASTEYKEAETQANITVERALSQAKITENKALASAEAIIDQYTKEAEVYADIVGPAGLNLTIEGFLSYIGIRAISSAKNPVYIGLKGPAKTSYVTP